MNYYEFHVGDYLKNTSRLSLVEHGVYTILLADYYANEVGLPEKYDVLCRICRAFSKEERQAVKTVADAYFPVGNDGLRHNKRADEEIAKYLERCEKAKRSAEKRWANNDAKADANAYANADANAHAKAYANRHAKRMQRAPVPTSHKPQEEQKKKKPCPAGAGRFEEFWTVYPRHEGKKKAIEVWTRKRLDGMADRLIADVKLRTTEHRPWRDGFIPHAERYLRDERWNDAIDRPRLAADEAPDYAVGAL